jgi:Domain of unknown function (DUF4288)
MNWYAAHIIISSRPIKLGNGEIDVYENVILISAENDDEANFKAQQFGQAFVVKDDTLTTMEGDPVEDSFVGIRKIIQVRNPLSLSPDNDKPVDGAEITYSRFTVKDDVDLAKLVDGEEVVISYLD